MKKIDVHSYFGICDVLSIAQNRYSANCDDGRREGQNERFDHTGINQTRMVTATTLPRRVHQDPQGVLAPAALRVAVPA